MYHRVASVPHDPWGLAVSPEHFDEQMHWLGQHRHVLPMADFVAGVKNGTLSRRAVGITFDDGYLDNMTAAEPILRGYGLPATLFALPAYPEHRSGFWWDELAGLILACRDAMNASLLIGDTPVGLLWMADVEGARSSSWRAWQPPQTPRQAAYLEVWQLLRRRSPADRSSIMAALRELLPRVQHDQGRIMTEGELAEVCDRAALTVGGHGVTHSPLTALNAPALDDEVARSFRWCRSLAGDAVPGFAYPYGDVNRVVRDAVEESGFAWACTTREGPVMTRQDPFDLPRLAVADWTANCFSSAVRSVGAR